MIRLRINSGAVKVMAVINSLRGGIEMKKNLLLWQMITGLVICGLVLITFFMPRYALNAKKISNVFSSFANSHIKDVMELQGSDDEEEVREDIADEEEYVEESVNEAIDQLKEYGIPYRFSSFYILTHSVKSMAKKAVEKSGLGSGTTEALMGLSGVDEQLEEFSTKYNLFRLYLAATMILPLLVIAGILLAWSGKIKKWLALVTAWIWIVLEAGYLLMIQFILPGKMSDGFGGSYIDMSDMMDKLMRKILWSFHGSGFTLCTILTFLLLAWTIWCCILNGLKGVSGAGAGAFSAGGTVFSPLQQLDNVLLNNERQPAGNKALPPAGNKVLQPAVIHGIAGTILGADIQLNAGEKIIIGRDPSVCQLILSDVKVSRKHCSISFQAKTNRYFIECYSINGIYFSDNRKIAAGQAVEVERGTRLIMADGREVLELN